MLSETKSDFFSIENNVRLLADKSLRERKKKKYQLNYISFTTLNYRHPNERLKCNYENRFGFQHSTKLCEQ